MKIKSVIFSSFKVDGQKMFGNTNKKLWNAAYPSDEKGLCTWALRSLLIDDGQNIVLIDSGFSNLNNQNLTDYYITNFKSATNLIEESGVNCNQINYLVNTHLHLDHCGGSFKFDDNQNPEPTFPNATYIISKGQLISAINPSAFEKDSFQPEITEAFQKHTNLEAIESNRYILPWLELRLFDGHTKELMVPVIHLPDKTLVFAGDLIPSIAHLSLESIMSYNIDKVKSLREQQDFLKESFENKYLIFFQHDYYYECCSLKIINNKIKPDKFFRIEEF
jgi:glyoxylase-like metal-dependent hydrolase (beta-lactamase superfamily II)